ncbi:S-methyl-5-thioribose kinase [Paenibacillus sp. MER TA 81-3]|uniref:S-methyl-5-thioribose kinase n=1 Tax=Paenibacillus sp. MER TA 81-3 TaxID=2939573 RepID=UPI00203ADBF0|nr:S-methyl-5-thioribose kinase [Paenibacillus sp. MER TA 81-3]MCM3337956.1 S-methyl-5-thioribose kinase [Paenibacillus sp. MER TA 81-3]
MTKSTVYRPLCIEDAVQLARNIEGVFPPTASLRCEEIGDGNLNLVFRVYEISKDTTDSALSPRRIIIKQALPYAKVVGESWPLTLDRARIESQALIAQGQLVPHLVPKVYLYNPDLALTVMEDLSDYTIMRTGLMQRNHYPLFAEHIAEFLAKTLFFSSDLGLNQQDKKRNVERFINPELCKITEDLIFDDPYTASPNNNCDAAIEDELKKLSQDRGLQFEVMLLREKFLTQAQALLHGDLHTGSIFITPESTKVIDPEFAYYGPMGFDIGAIIANLILNTISQEYWSADEETRRQFRAYLLQMVRDIWNQFESRFRSLWDNHVVDRMAQTDGYQDTYLTRVLQDSVGYAGCKMIRRIVGLAHVADIDSISDLHVRERAQRTALFIGKRLVNMNRRIQSIDEVITACEHGNAGVQA